jgi:hypothetical protein
METNPISKCAQSSATHFDVKFLRTLSLLSILASLSGCETISSNPPVVTSAMALGDVRVEVLTEGRALFVSRCIDCHSLPLVVKYSSEQWPGLVSKMAGRAHLQPAQREAIVAYILAARENGLKDR